MSSNFLPIGLSGDVKPLFALRCTAEDDEGTRCVGARDHIGKHAGWTKPDVCFTIWDYDAREKDLISDGE